MVIGGRDVLAFDDPPDFNSLVSRFHVGGVHKLNFSFLRSLRLHLLLLSFATLFAAQSLFSTHTHTHTHKHSLLQTHARFAVRPASRSLLISLATRLHLLVSTEATILIDPTESSPPT